VGPPQLRGGVSVGARVASGVRSAVQAISGLAESVRRRASLATRTTAERASAVAAGVAGVTSQGLRMVAVRPQGAVRRLGKPVALGAKPMLSLPHLPLLDHPRLALIAAQR
jgi:hypothetical protein